MPQNSPIVSPCILVCTLDLETGQCLGCGRTRGQIALWTRYSDEQRAQIMEDLPAELERLQSKA